MTRETIIQIHRIELLIRDFENYDIEFANRAKKALVAAVRENKIDELEKFESFLKESFLKLKEEIKKENNESMRKSLNTDLIKFIKKWGIFLTLGATAIGRLVGGNLLNKPTEQMNTIKDKIAIEENGPIEKDRYIDGVQGDRFVTVIDPTTGEEVYYSVTTNEDAELNEPEKTEEIKTETQIQETTELIKEEIHIEKVYFKDVKIEYKDKTHLTSGCLKQLCEAAENELGVYYEILGVDLYITKADFLSDLCMESSGVQKAENKGHYGLFQMNLESVEEAINGYLRLDKKAQDKINSMPEGEEKDKYQKMLDGTMFRNDFDGFTKEQLLELVKISPIASAYAAAGCRAQVAFQYYLTVGGNRIVIDMSWNGGGGRGYNMVNNGVIKINQKDGSVTINQDKLNQIKGKDGEKCREAVVYGVYADALNDIFSKHYDDCDVYEVWETVRKIPFVELKENNESFHFYTESEGEME